VTDVRDEIADANTNDHTALKSYLAYSCLRLAFLSHDALSDPKAALRLYKEAAVLDTMKPSAEAYDGIGTTIEACFGDLEQAAAAYETALRILEKDGHEGYPYDDDNSGFVKFHLSVALERLGRVEEAEEIMEGLRRSESKYACLVDSWGYIRWHTRRIETNELNLYLGTRDMMRIGLDAASDMLQDQRGLVCEFGVAKGRSMRMMQELLPLETQLHGFDTFFGLPQSWNSLPAGAFSTNGDIPNIEGEVYFHRGLFRDSIPAFLGSLEGEYQPLAFANIDALLYGSTLDILESMHSRVVPGTVFVFADYHCHPTWRQDEFRAWRECCKRFGWTYEYLGFSLATKQVVVRVTGA
jgi:tetratricopeptide (TPR) repeat protein